MNGAAQNGHGVFMPALLLALAVAGWNVFQSVHLLIERNNLTMAISGQDPQMEQSRQVRAKLDSIARRTAQLARDGNANATIIVEELRKRGITINPDQPAGEPAAP